MNRRNVAEAEDEVCGVAAEADGLASATEGQFDLGGPRPHEAPREDVTRDKLSGEERANIRKAFMFLVERERSDPDKLAEALRTTRVALAKARTRTQRPTVRLAALVACAAKVNLEDVLSGAWPGDLCPRCGQRGGASLGAPAGSPPTTDGEGSPRPAPTTDGEDRRDLMLTSSAGGAP